MSRLTRSSLLVPLCVFLTQCTPTATQSSKAITIEVDATAVPRRVLHTREAIPVAPGPLTLLYPKWIPGEHGPTGPVIDVAGIMISAGGKTLAWRRDLVDMYAIHVTVPTGVSSIEVSFDFLLPPEASGFTSGASSSPELLVLSWNQVLMYPSAPRPDAIQMSPTLLLPAGWKYATALTTSKLAGDTIHFAPVSLTMLVDAPVQAGLHARKIDLSSPSGVKTVLNLVADDEADLAIPAKQDVAYKALVTEAEALFGAHHFTHFDFLYTLSDQVAHFGLEHHQSNDDRVAARTLIDSNLIRLSADLLPHEFVHSWNGKYRRPAGLATGDFSTPMQGDLLWVYEGLTQYLGKILAARSGLLTPAEFREDQAALAARLDNQPGRTWRPLQDVADEAQLLYYTRPDWDAWRRSVDYYDEGDLIWLEADITIRQLTKGAKSLDDFCQAFHGGKSGEPAVKSYTFDDVVSTLNAIAPNDWKAFFAARIQAINPRAPLGGIEGGGWKLAYGESPTSMNRAAEAVSGNIDLRYSVGLLLTGTGTILDVIPGSPGGMAPLGPGMQVTMVNGVKFSRAAIHEALKQGKTATTALELQATNGSKPATFTLNYHGGDRYPYLARDAAAPDLLSAIIAPRGKKN